MVLRTSLSSRMNSTPMVVPLSLAWTRALASSSPRGTGSMPPSHWEAFDGWNAGTQDLQWYDRNYVTTKDGSLVVTIDRAPADYAHNTSFVSGQLSSWNMVCLCARLPVLVLELADHTHSTGGYVEVRVSLPGDNRGQGFWPAMWVNGNLARCVFALSRSECRSKKARTERDTARRPTAPGPTATKLAMSVRSRDKRRPAKRKRSVTACLDNDFQPAPAKPRKIIRDRRRMASGLVEERRRVCLTSSRFPPVPL